MVRGAEWDNWTDALFLNSTVTEFEGNLFEKAMANAYTISEDGSTSVIENINLAISDDEEPMIGASMNHYREGARINMTISDMDGFIHNCEITNGDVITFFYVGYKVKEVIIKDVNAIDGTLNVKMTKGSNKKKETIIIGE